MRTEDVQGVDGGGEGRARGRGEARPRWRRVPRMMGAVAVYTPPARAQLMHDPERERERRSAVKRARLLRGSYAPRLHCWCAAHDASAASRVCPSWRTRAGPALRTSEAGACEANLAITRTSSKIQRVSSTCIGAVCLGTLMVPTPMEYLCVARRGAQGVVLSKS